MSAFWIPYNLLVMVLIVSNCRLLVSIAETAPSMTKQYPNFARKVVPALLDLMSEQEEDPEWLLSEAFNDDDDESMSVMCVFQTHEAVFSLG